MWLVLQVRIKTFKKCVCPGKLWHWILLGITKELDEVGIPHLGVGPDIVESRESARAFPRDPNVGAVIVGFDEHFSYPKMVKAATYLADKNVHFIGTNTDEQFPTSENVIMPGELIWKLVSEIFRTSSYCLKPFLCFSIIFKLQKNWITMNIMMSFFLIYQVLEAWFAV